MENRNGRLIIYNTDIERWYGVKQKAGFSRCRKIKNALGIANEEDLTVYHLSIYLNVPVDELIKWLLD